MRLAGVEGGFRRELHCFLPPDRAPGWGSSPLIHSRTLSHTARAMSLPSSSGRRGAGPRVVFGSVSPAPSSSAKPKPAARQAPAGGKPALEPGRKHSSRALSFEEAASEPDSEEVKALYFQPGSPCSSLSNASTSSQTHTESNPLFDAEAASSAQDAEAGPALPALQSTQTASLARAFGKQLIALGQQHIALADATTAASIDLTLQLTDLRFDLGQPAPAALAELLAAAQGPSRQKKGTSTGVALRWLGRLCGALLLTTAALTAWVYLLFVEEQPRYFVPT